MSDPVPLRPGDPARVGGYELTGRLGEGGQGVVYLGRTPAGAPVAVKVLRSDLAQNEEALARFVREVSTAVRVATFCTAQVIETGVADQRPFIVSEYIDGPTLMAVVEREGPRQGAALHRLAIGTVTALVAIHQAGIVHRDFKPSNVLLGADGPRVIDFGIARALDRSSTLTSTLVGTPAYVTPEQLAGEQAGPAADMFAWAGTMVFAATGEPPFGADSLPAVFHRIMNLEPDLGALDERLRVIVAACLAKDPAARPAAGEVLMRLLGHDGAGPAPAAVIMAEGSAVAQPHLSHSWPGPATASGGRPYPPPPPRPGGPSLTGSSPAGPFSTGPFSTGSSLTGPSLNGSSLNGPSSAGRSSTGSSLNGPSFTDPSSAGPAEVRTAPPSASPTEGSSGGKGRLPLVVAGVVAGALVLGGAGYLIAQPSAGAPGPRVSADGTAGTQGRPGERAGRSSGPATSGGASPAATAPPAATRTIELPGSTVTIYESDGDPVRLTFYSLDNGTRAYIRDDGANSFTKTSKYFEYVVSGDGRRALGVDTLYTKDGHSAVSLVDRAGAGRTMIRIAKAPVYPSYPQWSPDGTKVLVTVNEAVGGTSRGRGYAIIDVARRKARIVHVKEKDVGRWSYFWRGDGRAVGTWALKGGTRRIRFYDLDGTVLQTLLRVGSPLTVEGDDMSPSGNLFLTSCAGRGQICVWTADGEERARFAFPTDRVIGWYDDAHIAAWRKKGRGYEAVVVDLKGRAGRVLATAGAAEYPKLSLRYTRAA
ncbi:protein kinase [Sphaerisporangium sp. NPDC005289]|uniref:protein kinase domain-containing protein n=1 Tax=Sphaerisporangium sp. NPDC005289 TaxID=3155247 RepID=UPI0033B43F19